MIHQEDNVLMLHYVLNGVIQRNQLDLQPEVVKLLTDAAYEVKGCLLDGMESFHLPVLMKEIRADRKYESITTNLAELEEQLLQTT